MSACPCDGERCKITAEDRRHGTENGYGNLLCRCESCREAHATYFREGKGAESLNRYRTSAKVRHARRSRIARRWINATAAYLGTSISDDEIDAIAAEAVKAEAAA